MVAILTTQRGREWLTERLAISFGLSLVGGEFELGLCNSGNKGKTERFHLKFLKDIWFCLF